MSNLSELLPAGAGAKSAEFVASGTLASGVTVILNSDGTVSAVAESAEGAGTPVVFEEDATGSSFGEFSLAHDTAQNKIVIVYSEAAPNYYGTAVVGTVSGTSISFGTPVVFNSAGTYFPATTYDSNAQKIVAVYRDAGNSNYGTAKVGTVSGTSISFGTGVVYSGTALAGYNNIVFDSTNNKVVVIWGDNLNSNYVTGSVGTVSGTSISFGTKVQAATAYTNYQYGISYDPTNGKVVTAFRNTANSSYGTAIVGSVSGTSISFGSPVVFASVSATREKVVYDSASTKTVVFYRDDSAADYVKAAVGTVSGTSISFGSIVSTNVRGNWFTAVANSDLGVINVGIIDTTYDGFNVVGTVSGTSISFGAPLEWKDAATLQYINGTYDPTAKKTIYAYNDFDNSQKGTAVVFQNESSNNTDFIGITDQAIADTATGAVIVQGGVASGVTLPYYYSFGTNVVFDNQLYTDGLTSTYDSNSNKVVISYSDSGNSGYATAIVGTVSGSDISFGTPVVAASTNASWFASTFDSSANKVVVAYRTATDTGEAVVGTVSGTSISFGSAAQFEPGRNAYTVATFDSSNSKVIIAYQDDLNSNYGTIVVGTVSGTSISFGSPVVFNSATTYYPGLTFDSNEGKVVLGYRDGSNGNAGTALIGTVSGTSISFGSSAVFQSGTTNWIAATFDSNSNKVLFTYNNSTAGKVAVGTVSGTSISFGTPVTFDAGNSNQFVTTFDSNLNQVFIVYRDSSNSTYGTIIAATISGTTATFSDAEVFAAVTVNVPQIVFDSNANKTVVSYVDTTATGSGTSIVTNLTNSLAVASDYYVQSDGSLSTTVSSVPAGRALSSTSILLEG